MPVVNTVVAVWVLIHIRRLAHFHFRVPLFVLLRVSGDA
jgi:hypothetical protein